jgi:hypothetical protein
MANLVVSTWHRHTVKHRTLGRSQRLQWLKVALQATQDKITQRGYPTSGLIKGIFVAPEYFFAAKNMGCQVGGKSRALSSAKHDQVVSTLANLSRAFPRILILPGTIAWKKALDQNELARRLRWYNGRHQNKPLLAGEQLTRALIAEFQWSNLDNTLTNSYDRDLYLQMNGQPLPTRLLTPADLEYVKQTSSGYYQFMLTVVNQSNLLGQGASCAEQLLNGPQSLTSMMQSTAYAFLNGEVVFEYVKQGNYHEELGAPGLINAPGARSGVQKIEGIHFGFEVCLDHFIGTLKSQLRNGRHLDVQVVMSDAVDYKPAHAVVRDGGYFVHASTNPDMNGVWQINNYQAKPAPSLGKDKIDGTRLTHWHISVAQDDPFDLTGTFMQDQHDPFELEGTFLQRLKEPVKKWPVVKMQQGFRSGG